MYLCMYMCVSLVKIHTIIGPANCKTATECSSQWCRIPADVLGLLFQNTPFWSITSHHSSTVRTLR